MQSGAIWIIDDDMDDREMVREVWEELALENELVWLNSGEEAFQLLEKVAVAPFIIICDLHLPRMNGFQLREAILATNSKKFKSVPFIFWSTNASEEEITKAYNLSVHGFFIKEISFTDLKKTFVDILNYWFKSKMPAKRG